MRLRAALALALVIAAACSEQSRVAPDAAVTVRGTVEDVDGTPLSSRAVRLGSGVSGLEGVAGALTVGVFCITGECSGDSFNATSDADGQYRFELTGADTQSTFGEAESFLVSTSAEPHGDQARGPAVSARFRIQVESLTLPTLRLVDPQLQLSSAGPAVDARWEPAAPGPYALGFTGRSPAERFSSGGRALVWEAQAAEAGASFDGRVLEDAIGVVTVAGASETEAAGSKVTIRWRSPGLAYRGGFGAPPSRGARCEALGGGLTAELDGCRLTDGSFEVGGVLGSVCEEASRATGTSTGERCAPVERVRVHLPRPVAAELVVVRGCAQACRVATVAADGGAPEDAGSVTGPFATLALGGQRVGAVDVVTAEPTDLVEVSVWGAVDGPPLRAVEDLDDVADETGAGDEDGSRRRLAAVVATVVLLGALVLLFLAAVRVRDGER